MGRFADFGLLKSLGYAVSMLRGKDNRRRPGSKRSLQVARRLEEELLSRRRYARDGIRERRRIAKERREASPEVVESEKV